MEFSHIVRENILVITPQVEKLDAMSAPAFKGEILDFIHQKEMKNLIIDLSHLQFIDSSGLGAFLSIQRTLNKQGGTLKLAYLNKTVQTMFEIVSMHRILDIFPTVDEAVKSF
jgi:anti-anti-sigma factor